MTIWAPLAKSPNWASQATRASGDLDRVAVLEAQRGVLRQQRVVDGEVARLLAAPDGPAGPIPCPVRVVDEDGVALAEGPPPGVLTGQPHVGAFEQQRPDGQSLAERPVHLALGHHCGPLLELAGQLGMDGEALGHRRGVDHQALEGRGATPVATGVARRRAAERRRQCGRPGGGRLAGLVQGRLQAGLEVGQGLLGLLHGDVAPADEGLGVELAHRAHRLR